MNNMSFGEALFLIKSGKLVTRLNWNDKKYVFLVPGSNFIVNRPPLLGIFKEGAEIRYQAHIDCCWLDGTISPWVPSQQDILSLDWIELNA